MAPSLVDSLREALGPKEPVLSRADLLKEAEGLAPEDLTASHHAALQEAATAEDQVAALKREAQEAVGVAEQALAEASLAASAGVEAAQKRLDNARARVDTLAGVDEEPVEPVAEPVKTKKEKPPPADNA